MAKPEEGIVSRDKEIVTGYSVNIMGVPTVFFTLPAEGQKTKIQYGIRMKKKDDPVKLGHLYAEDNSCYAVLPDIATRHDIMCYRVIQTRGSERHSTKWVTIKSFPGIDGVVEFLDAMREKDE